MYKEHTTSGKSQVVCVINRKYSKINFFYVVVCNPKENGVCNPSAAIDTYLIHAVERTVAPLVQIGSFLGPGIDDRFPSVYFGPGIGDRVHSIHLYSHNPLYITQQS